MLPHRAYGRGGLQPHHTTAARRSSSASSSTAASRARQPNAAAATAPAGRRSSSASPGATRRRSSSQAMPALDAGDSMFADADGDSPSSSPPLRPRAHADEESRRVRCYVRVRPFTPADLVGSDGQRTEFNQTALSQGLDGRSLRITGENAMAFDGVFDPSADLEDILGATVAPAVSDSLRGLHTAVLLYGQTGSGKTFTASQMLPAYMDALLQFVAEDAERYATVVTVECCQLYLESVYDLLDPSKGELQLREFPDTGVFVRGITEIEIRAMRDFETVLSAVDANRAVAATRLNQSSSRSHCVFTVNVSRRRRVRRGDFSLNASAAHNTTTGPDATLGSHAAGADDDVPAAALLHGRAMFVDLAGSERLKKSGSEGIRQVEASYINQSLSTLGNVMHALTDARATHVPYRDSKLTRLLQDALGGRGVASVVVTVSPSVNHVTETRQALTFGMRAMEILSTATAWKQVDGETRLVEAQEFLEGRAHWLEVRCRQLETDNVSLRAKLAGNSSETPSSVMDTHSVACSAATVAGCSGCRDLELQLEEARSSASNTARQMQTELKAGAAEVRRLVAQVESLSNDAEYYRRRAEEAESKNAATADPSSEVSLASNAPIAAQTAAAEAAADLRLDAMKGYYEGQMEAERAAASEARRDYNRACVELHQVSRDLARSKQEAATALQQPAVADRCVGTAAGPDGHMVAAAAQATPAVHTAEVQTPAPAAADLRTRGVQATAPATSRGVDAPQHPSAATSTDVSGSSTAAARTASAACQHVPSVNVAAGDAFWRAVGVWMSAATTAAAVATSAKESEFRAARSEVRRAAEGAASKHELHAQLQGAAELARRALSWSTAVSSVSFDACDSLRDHTLKSCVAVSRLQSTATRDAVWDAKEETAVVAMLGTRFSRLTSARVSALTRAFGLCDGLYHASAGILAEAQGVAHAEDVQRSVLSSSEASDRACILRLAAHGACRLARDAEMRCADHESVAVMQLHEARRTSYRAASAAVDFVDWAMLASQHASQALLSKGKTLASAAGSVATSATIGEAEVFCRGALLETEETARVTIVTAAHAAAATAAAQGSRSVAALVAERREAEHQAAWDVQAVRLVADEAVVRGVLVSDADAFRAQALAGLLELARNCADDAAVHALGVASTSVFTGREVLEDAEQRARAAILDAERAVGKALGHSFRARMCAFSAAQAEVLESAVRADIVESAEEAYTSLARALLRAAVATGASEAARGEERRAAAQVAQEELHDSLVVRHLELAEHAARREIESVASAAFAVAVVAARPSAHQAGMPANAAFSLASRAFGLGCDHGAEALAVSVALGSEACQMASVASLVGEDLRGRYDVVTCEAVGRDQIQLDAFSSLVAAMNAERAQHVIAQAHGDATRSQSSSLQEIEFASRRAIESDEVVRFAAVMGQLLSNVIEAAESAGFDSRSLRKQLDTSRRRAAMFAEEFESASSMVTVITDEGSARTSLIQAEFATRVDALQRSERDFRQLLRNAAGVTVEARSTAALVAAEDRGRGELADAESAARFAALRGLQDVTSQLQRSAAREVHAAEASVRGAVEWGEAAARGQLQRVASMAIDSVLAAPRCASVAVQASEPSVTVCLVATATQIDPMPTLTREVQATATQRTSSTEPAVAVTRNAGTDTSESLGRLWSAVGVQTAPDAASLDHDMEAAAHMRARVASVCASQLDHAEAVVAAARHEVAAQLHRHAVERPPSPPATSLSSNASTTVATSGSQTERRSQRSSATSAEGTPTVDCATDSLHPRLVSEGVQASQRQSVADSQTTRERLYNSSVQASVVTFAATSQAGAAVLSFGTQCDEVRAPVRSQCTSTEEIAIVASDLVAPNAAYTAAIAPRAELLADAVVAKSSVALATVLALPGSSQQSEPHAADEQRRESQLPMLSATNVEANSIRRLARLQQMAVDVRYNATQPPRSPEQRCGESTHQQSSCVNSRSLTSAVASPNPLEARQQVGASQSAAMRIVATADPMSDSDSVSSSATSAQEARLPVPQPRRLARASQPLSLLDSTDATSAAGPQLSPIRVVGRPQDQTLSVLDSPRQTPTPVTAGVATPAPLLVDACTATAFAPLRTPATAHAAVGCAPDAPRVTSADVGTTAEFSTPQPPTPERRARAAAVDISVSSSGDGNPSAQLGGAENCSDFDEQSHAGGLYMGRLDLGLTPLPGALPRQITPGEASPRMPTPTELTVIDRLLERSVLSVPPHKVGDEAAVRRALHQGTRPHSAALSVPAHRAAPGSAALREGDTPLRQRPRERTPATAAVRLATPSTGPAHAATSRAKARPLPGDDKPLMTAVAGIGSSPASKIPRHHGCSCATLGPRDTESGRALPKHRRARSALAAFARLDRVAAAKEDVAMLAANTSVATTTESTRGRRVGTPRKVPVPTPRPMHTLASGTRR